MSLKYKTIFHKKKFKIIEQFMKERDLPEWFRGLSYFQMKAADSLLNSIRDDSEQETSHRVKEVLFQIGLDPLLSSSKIKFAMRLSRGNDIAFLWFLMELYYRSSSKLQKHSSVMKYNVNEQIIMSIIAHLDTIPTLRELNKLLPKPNAKSKVQITVKRNKSRPILNLPYFKKQRRPVMFGKSLVLNELDRVANFSEYRKYMDPHFSVANERNRWFASYQFKKSERIVKGIIRREIEGILKKENDGILEKLKDNVTLCSHHETLKAIQESMVNELKVAQSKACEKYFDVQGRLKHQSYKRVMDQLNNEIAKAEESIKKLTIKTLQTERFLTEDENIIERTQRYSHKSSSSTKQKFYDDLNRFDFGYATVPYVKSKYFHAATENKPYKFNYNKIFDFGAKDPIKDAIGNALTEDSSENMSIEHGRAVRKCCKRMWKEEVQNFNSTYLKNKKAQENNHSKVSEEKGLRFDLDSFNPNDKDFEKTMKNILHMAMEDIKKNKKFVLASLPDAHKVPILKEWIKRRYGKVYSRSEKLKTFRLSKKVFYVLRKTGIHARLPRLNELSSKRMVSYGCKNYILKKTNFLKGKYYRQFKENLLDEARISWGVMRAYQCPKGPPRNIFYAYLPARAHDVHLFRPWKQREYMHAQEEWNKRQRIKNQSKQLKIIKSYNKT